MTPLAEITDYDGLIVALRAKAGALAVSRLSIDEVAGPCTGMAGKTLGAKRTPSITKISLGPLLSVAGLKLIVVEDPEALVIYRSQMPTRNPNLVRHKRCDEQAV